jgi:hypothetical protein
MAIIPTDRIWTPVYGTNLGVEDGIPGMVGGPAARTLGETADAATYGTGAIDATQHILDKMAATGTDEYCYLPAGTYNCYSRLLWYPSFKTLKGAGPGLTTILLRDEGNNEGIHVGTSMTPVTATVITSQATPGRVTVTSTAGHAIGQLIQFRATGVDYVVAAVQTDPRYGPGEQAVETDPKSFSSMHYITNIIGNDIYFKPDLEWTIPGTPEAVVFNTGLVHRFGIEDLTLDCDGLVGYPILFEGTVSCWVKNVEIKESDGYGISVIYSIFTEIRKVYLHSYDPPVGGSGSNSEGITLNNDVSWALIEDNIIYEGGYPGVCLGNGFTAGSISGCVVGYNFSSGAWYNDDPFAHGMACHGGHCAFIIFEGNITDGFAGDSYYGSMSHMTYHRNWGLAKHPNMDQGTPFAFNINRWSNYVNLTGNVVGDSTFNPATQGGIWLGYPSFGNGTSTSGNDWGPQTPPTYRLQFANGDILDRDLNVEATVLEHGNWEYSGGGSGAQSWDAGIADHDLPASYYTTKAEMEDRGVVWGSLTFPPINPASPPGAYNNTTLSILPAGYRFVNDAEPPVNSGTITVSTLTVGTLTIL